MTLRPPLVVLLLAACNAGEVTLPPPNDGPLGDRQTLPPDSRRPADALPPRDQRGPADSTSSPCGQSLEKHFNGHCYQALGYKWMDFDAAVQICANIGAKPASIHSAAEDQFVYGLLPPLNSAAWIGLRRQGNTFVWTDGTPLDYTNWGPGEPNNENGTESCTVLWGPNVSVVALRSTWNDAPCSDPGRDTIVCKRKL